MRIGIHDFSGHPFQVQLSRELASRGHEVVHWHCPSYVTGKGAVESSAADPSTFRLQPIPLTRAFSKYSMRRRLQQERAYGRALSAAAAAFAPDVLVSSNNPLLSQQVLLRTCERLGLPFVFWQQDIYSVAMARVAKSRYPLLGSMMGRYLLRLEASMLRRSAKVVAISEDFLPVLRSWGVHDENVVVIENWAPLDDLPMAPRDNAWARERELVGSRVFLYSGTLGVKHNPEMLVELAEQYRGTDTRVVVLSEGLGADFLRRASAQRGLDNLAVLPFQPFQQLPMVFASADVLVAILDAPAGSYSVPSKVLSYHCAGRPILAALPQDNLAARVVDRAKSGIVVDPSSTVAFVSGARRLLEDEELRLRCGENARTFAETAFDIDQIAEPIRGDLRRACAGSRNPESGFARRGNMSEKVLVTGAGGFIGGHLVASLQEQGHDVRAVDVKPLDEWYQMHGDVENQAERPRPNRRPAATPCAASMLSTTSPPTWAAWASSRPTRPLCMLSVLINTHMLIAAREAGVERFFYLVVGLRLRGRQADRRRRHRAQGGGRLSRPCPRTATAGRSCSASACAGTSARTSASRPASRATTTSTARTAPTTAAARRRRPRSAARSIAGEAVGQARDRDLGRRRADPQLHVHRRLRRRARSG